MDAGSPEAETVPDGSCGDQKASGSGKVCDDKAALIAKLDFEGFSLALGSPRLQDDPEVVLVAVSQSGLALQYASERLRDDFHCAFAAVSSFGWSLQFVSERLCDDDKVVLAAVEYDGFALVFASERLKDNERIVRQASIRSDGVALRHASKRLRSDPDFCLSLMEKEAGAIYFASTSLRNDPKFVILAAGKKHGIGWTSDELRSDSSFLHDALDLDPSNLRHVLRQPNDEEQWRELCLHAVAQDGDTLSLCGELRSDPEVVSLALSSSWPAWRYCSAELKQDPTFVRDMLAREPRIKQLIQLENADIDDSLQGEMDGGYLKGDVQACLKAEHGIEYEDEDQVSCDLDEEDEENDLRTPTDETPSTVASLREKTYAIVAQVKASAGIHTLSVSLDDVDVEDDGPSCLSLGIEEQQEPSGDEIATTVGSSSSSSSSSDSEQQTLPSTTKS